MGILNVTPDSFSDGGLQQDQQQAIEAGCAMWDAGAAVIDVGGESTRPGAAPVPPQQEIDRVLPVVRALADRGIVVSVDTRNSATMAAALDAGAAIINDVSGLTHDPASAPLIARRGCCAILMHMRGTPQTMLGLARYDDVVAEVGAELGQVVQRALGHGIRPDRIAVDPGIGFAKDGAQNVRLLRDLAALERLGHPLVVGVSRKRFIGQLSGADDPARRDAGSLAAGLFAVLRGARLLRVHDVPGTVQALRVWQALGG